MFLLSLFLVLLSSYFIVSFLHFKYSNNKFPAFIYFVLTAFSQIILSFEILSLLKKISVGGVFAFNIIFLLMGVFLFYKSNRHFYIPKTENILCALKKDKLLAILGICFLIFLCVNFILLFAPVKFGDALNYYLPRCTMWIQQGSILHYITPDTRELIMPVNIEFLYTWFLLLNKSEIGIGIFSYIGFLAGIYVLYNFLRETKCSLRRSIWSVFVFSSFALVAIETVIPCSDLIIGVLVLSSIYLFLISVKHEDKIPLIFSALSYAIAIGSKTTAFMTIPASLFIFCTILFLWGKQKKKYQLAEFILFFVIFFVIFSSYNYILNYLQFSHPVSDRQMMLIHRLDGGFKGFLCNFIKYIFIIFDTSGINTIIDFNGFITALQSAVLGLAGETTKSYTSDYFAKEFFYNPVMSIQSSALGIMGIFAFLPSFIKSFFNKKCTKRAKLYFVLSFALIINIVVLSAVMVFAQYNIRYLLTFFIISLPVTAYSYIRTNKHFCKILMCFFMFIYLVFNPIYAIFQKQAGETRFSPLKTEEFLIFNAFRGIPPQNIRIALVIPQDRMPVYHIEKLRLYGYKLDKLLVENIEAYDLLKYDYIVTSKLDTIATNIVKSPESSNSVTSCTYYDKKQNIILKGDKAESAMVACEPAIGYFFKNNFDLIYNGGHYVILKRGIPAKAELN